MAKSLEFLELDFFNPNDAIIAITYSSADFRELGVNRGVYSKTVKMPSTKVNDTFFGMSFGVTNEGFFDPLIKVPIQISEIEFYGTLQLKSVEILGGQTQGYSVNIFGDLTDWASLIGETSIRDLVWHTGRSHRLDEETISASWTHTGLNDTYTYPLISYGNFLQDKDPSESIDVAFWRPAFFALPIIKNIFKEIGYNFISTGIESTPFRDAILLFTSKDIEASDKVVIANTDGFSFIADINNDLNVNTLFSRTDLKFFNEIQDNGGLYNNDTGIYIVPADDSYDINIDFNIKAVVTDHRSTRSSSTELVTVRIVFLDLDTDKTIVLSDTKTYLKGSIEDVIIVNGTFTLKKDSRLKLSVETIQENQTRIRVTEFILTSEEDIKSNNIKITPRLSTLTSGDLLVHSKVIQNIKKIDLIKEIMKMGNFRILTNNQSKTVEFVQEGNFLLSTPEEWSDKVDESKPVSLSLIQNQGAKELTWNYNNDTNDGFINDKTDRQDKEWAKSEIQLESEYRKGTNNVHSSVFSSTIDGIGGDGLRVPVMSTQELKQDEVIPRGDFETNFTNRILIYHGLVDGDFVIDNVSKTQYPQSSFNSDTLNLSWDSVNGIGLVDRYYQNAIQRLNKSRLYTGWFFLNDLDISTLDFRKPKIINGVQYYLNKVIDYQLNTNQPTKVELISR